MPDDATVPELTDEEKKWAAIRASNEKNAAETVGRQSAMGDALKSLGRGGPSGTSGSMFKIPEITKADTDAYSKDLELRHQDYAERHLD